jgi:ornithine--oxo-acid transaminase
MNKKITEIFAEREAERGALHSKYLNDQMVRVLRTIGYDVGFRSGSGQYLYDRDGTKYLDLLAGFGVFAIGRNHPVMREALKDVLDADLPNLVQMDVSVLAGVLAERLLRLVPQLDKVVFTNSGTEAVEAAIKFARAATRRPGVVYCENSFHGLSYGSLSIMGDKMFRNGFEPMLPGCFEVPFNDLAALERALASRSVAAFIVEPIQGKGVNVPDSHYLREAAQLCRRHGTLFVADEIQTGLGRTGRFLALEHYDVEPDMVLLAKALSGGHVPVGALLMRQRIYESVFDRMDRSVVHGSTFGKNDLAMAAGIVTLDLLTEGGIMANGARVGARLLENLSAMVKRFEFLQDVRGKGLMIGLQFGPPQSMKLKLSWNMIEAVTKGLFCQLITIPLLRDHKILAQVAGHGSHTVKLLPPLGLTDADCAWIEGAFEDVIAGSHQVPGAAWSLGKTLAGHALRASA